MGTERCATWLRAAVLVAAQFVAGAALAAGQVVLIDFGGTIAGQASAPNATNYDSGMRDIGSIVEEMRAAIAARDGDLPPWLETLQVDDSLPSGGSSSITERMWVQLHDRVMDYAARDDVAGVVISHGTDTLEESAFFLHLTLKTQKPVVFVGAMRASNQFGADGPLNLYNAVAVAASEEAAGRGVLVVLNDAIHSARGVAKTNTLAPDTFRADGAGPIGHVYFGRPRFFTTPTRPHTLLTPFAAADLLTGPAADESSAPRHRVDVLYFYAGNTGDDLRAAIARGSDGIVWAGAGAGAVGGGAGDAMQALCEEGGAELPPFVYASRTGGGPVLNQVDADDGECPVRTGAYDFNPQKARILLLLALSVGWNDETALRHAFATY